MVNQHCLSPAEEKNAQYLFEAAEARRRQTAGDPNGDWVAVKRGYSEVIQYLHGICQRTHRALWEIPVDAKWNIINSLIWSCYCDLQFRKLSGPDILYYDDPRYIAKIIDQLELEIRRYELGKPQLYNLLQCRYDQWCEEYRAQGKKYEADELQYFMLKSRMKWSLSNFAPKIPLIAQTWERFNAQLRTAFAKPLAWIDKACNYYHIVSDAVRAVFEWVLYGIGKSLMWPFLLFIIFPILFFACIYQHFGCVYLPLAGDGQALLNDFWSNLVYSVLVFTGSEVGPLSMCTMSAGIFRVMALEAFFAYTSAILIIGYLVNRLSNR